MRLLLIRHGQTTSNVVHALDTAEPGADLTELGRAQAAAVPGALAGRPVDMIFVSTLVRTQQTAVPLAQERGLQPVVRGGVREVSAGDYEMRSDEDALRDYVDIVFSWPEHMDRGLPGGETGEQAVSRFDQVVAEAADSGAQNVVIFSHGAIIRAYAAMRAHNVDAEFAATRWLRNTGMVVLEGAPGADWEMTEWVEDPLGGRALDGDVAEDPTGAPEAETMD